MKGRVILLSAFLSLYATTIIAQEFGVSLAQRVQQSHLVIEGKVIRQESFWDQAHQSIYTANTIDVYKIFKGSIRSTTIEVTTPGGFVGDRGLIVSDAELLNREQTGIFILNENSLAARFPLGHVSSYEMVAGQDGVISYDMRHVSAKDRQVNYGNVGPELYRQIEQLTQEPTRELKVIPVTPSNRKTQAATITSFSPTTVHAGAILDPANNILTINGTGFGPDTLSAAVYFDDPNDGAGGNYTVIPFSSKYVVSWSATQIMVRVPGASGTGLIAVRDSGGVVTYSSGPLTVDYSVLSVEIASGVFQPKMMNQNGTGGYNLRYSTRTTGGGANMNTAPEKAPFQRALDTWNKTTGVNLTVSGTTTNQTVAADGINTVELDNTNTGVGVLPAGVLGRTYTSVGMCPSATNLEIYDIDMVFRRAGVSAGGTINMNSTTCAPASNEVDFESVMLHELGHAHSLQHINDGPVGGDPEKVMNYAIFFGLLRRSPDASAFNGSLYAMQPSSNTYGACSPNTEMIQLATNYPSNDNCPSSFPASTPPGLTAIDMRYSTSNKYVDPSPSQIVCSGTSGLYNTVYLPFQTNATGGDLTALISGYTTLVDYSACAGMGTRMTLFQLSACPGGSSFPTAVDCRTIDLTGTMSPAGAFINLAANTAYLFVFDGILNTKATFNVTLGGAALPVRMIDFYGRKEGTAAQLTWHTAFEDNNKGFEVERSYDGRKFDDIGYVTAKGGNSATINQYQFNDTGPLQARNFYRLRQIDKDGNFEYSKVVLVESSNDGGVFRVLQNPFQNQLDVQFEKSVHGQIAWKLMDMNGRTMVSGSVDANGSNTIRIMLENNSLGSGVYLLQINTPDKQYVKKLVH